jgi:hypothetical protein
MDAVGAVYFGLAVLFLLVAATAVVVWRVKRRRSETPQERVPARSLRLSTQPLHPW